MAEVVQLRPSEEKPFSTTAFLDFLESGGDVEEAMVFFRLDMNQLRLIAQDDPGFQVLCECMLWNYYNNELNNLRSAMA